MINLIKIQKYLIEKFKTIINYLRIFIHRFNSDHCPHVAAALTFTSLLALVPLLAISVTIIKQIPAAQEFLSVGQEYLFQIFAPEYGKEVKGYLVAFVSKTQSLTTIGIIFLAITALLTLDTIEKTLNAIWRVKKSRNFLVRFAIYFIILSLGPVLVGISLTVTTYLSTLSFFADTISIEVAGYNYLALLPLVTTTIAFTLVYKIVPNVKVPIRYALQGGLVAALLFEASKRGFAYFLTSFSTYQLIYGALAAIPLTLIWFYVSWLVILIGAEVTASASDYANQKNQTKVKYQLDLCIVIKLLGDIGFLSKQETVNSEQIMKGESHISDEIIKATLEQLEALGFIKQSSDTWQLSKSKSSYTLQELMSICSPCCIEYSHYTELDNVVSRNIEHALSTIHTELKKSKPILLQNIYE